jgi:hypothetical protein
MFPTPTPFPTPASTPAFLANFDVQQFGQGFATDVVQGWNIFDAQTISGVIWFILLAFIIVGGLMSIRAHLEKL